MSGLVGKRLRRQPRNDGNASPMAGPGEWGNAAVGAYSTPCHCDGHLLAAGRYRAGSQKAMGHRQCRGQEFQAGNFRAFTRNCSRKKFYRRRPGREFEPHPGQRQFQGRNISSAVITLSPAPERLMCIAMVAAGRPAPPHHVQSPKGKTCHSPIHAA